MGALLSVLVALLAALTGSAVAASVPPAPAPGRFTTDGNRIIGPDGKPFVVHGVNRNGFEVLPASYWYSDADFGHMRRWGANTVRLPLSEVFWNVASCEFDRAYRHRVDDAVHAITSRGMVALLDLHTNSPHNTTCNGARPRQQLMADTGSLAFWRSVAARYRDNPLVAFDLYNEPHDISAHVWRDGGWVRDPANGVWRAVGMQELYDAVRSSGARNLVFVSGNDWASNVQVALERPVVGFNVVYATHAYDGDTCGEVAASHDDHNWVPTAASYPVVLTEFGTHCPDKGRGAGYNRSVVDYADAHHLGWLAFAWNADPDASSYSLLASWRTYSPSIVGRPIWSALRRY